MSKLRLGVFIVATLVIFAASVFWIGKKQYLFSSTYRLKADFQNVAGLNGGATVRVGGVHEGTVKHIYLPQRPNESVHVVMELAPATRDVIKKDSVAVIKSEGLVGEKFLEISFGSPQAAKVNDGDTIRGEPPLEISDLINKTSVVLDSTKEAMGNIEEAAGNLNSISSKINQGKGTIGALINDKKVYEEVKGGATAFQENMEALKHNFFLRGFFKRRGYQDVEELTRHEISRLPAQPVARKFAYDAKKLFDKPDTAELKDEDALKEAGRYLENEPFGLVVVAASSDVKGDAQKNRELTQARAMVVRDYLAKHFELDDTRVKTIGLGESPNAGEDGSVDILIYAREARGASSGTHSPSSQ